MALILCVVAFMVSTVLAVWLQPVTRAGGTGSATTRGAAFYRATVVTLCALLLIGAATPAGAVDAGAQRPSSAVLPLSGDPVQHDYDLDATRADAAGVLSLSVRDAYATRARGGTDFMSGEGGAAVDTSRAGVTRVGDDAVSVRVGERAPVAPGEHNVVVHGDQAGLTGATQAEVNAAVSGNPAASGCTIRFMSCFGASNGSGQALADATGQNVWAATSRVGIPRQGPPYPITLDKGGIWQLLTPGGG